MGIVNTYAALNLRFYKIYLQNFAALTRDALAKEMHVPADRKAPILSNVLEKALSSFQAQAGKASHHVSITRCHDFPGLKTNFFACSMSPLHLCAEFSKIGLSTYHFRRKLSITNYSINERIYTHMNLTGRMVITILIV